MPEPTPLFEIKVVVRIDDEGNALHKEATRLSKAGEWDAAIAVLRQINARPGVRDGSLGPAGVRLPLFLQRAGKFDEAMTEFYRLLNAVEAEVARAYSHHPQRFWAGIGAVAREQIYDKMRVACTRQGLPGQANRYAVFRDRFRAVHDQHRIDFDVYNRERLNLPPRPVQNQA